MNIGIFTDTYKPNINGVVTSIENKKQELEKLGHMVYIFSPKEPGYTETEKNVFSIPSIKFILQPEYRLTSPIDPKLVKLVKKLKLNIIHVETPFTVGSVGRMIARKLKIPVVHTYHTLFPEYVHYLRLPVAITKPFAEKLSAHFCNKCDYIISPSTDVKTQLLRYGVKKPITVVPSGISFDITYKCFDRSLRESLGIKTEEKVLLFVGRLGKEKNIEFLIDSFSKLKKMNHALKLLLVGNGPYKGVLEAQVKRLGLENEVIFAGYIPRVAVYRYYATADMFVFASVTETQGLVILEAMFCGLPVVAVKASGVEDMVEDGISGFLTPLDINLFNEKILQVIGNLELQKTFIVNGEKRAQDFSPENTVRKIFDIYQGCIDEKHLKKIRGVMKKLESGIFHVLVRQPRKRKKDYSKKRHRRY
ncbi:MAG: glycosyltransferase family 4 protein [Fusobacteria bacterium]|nr:glycosyltransferase family 4 protein [Fusobacteriota bacterium]